MAENKRPSFGHDGEAGFTPLNKRLELECQCLGCARYNGNKRCDAFPAGIPEAVWDNIILHDKPIDGDRGLRWASPTTLEPMHAPPTHT